MARGGYNAAFVFAALPFEGENGSVPTEAFAVDYTLGSDLSFESDYEALVSCIPALIGTSRNSTAWKIRLWVSPTLVANSYAHTPLLG